MHPDPLHPSNIYKAFVNGNFLTDAQVNAGVIFYKALADNLIQCGPVFHTSFKEANHVYMHLEDYQTARKKARE